ncbi:hypothetical protein KCU88_g4312, partial [Aureobasidium melanogenum]
MINAILVFNNNGQPRLTKFYSQLDTATQQSLLSQIFTLVSARPASACNFLPLPPLLAPSANSSSPDAPTQITYRHYATLYFILISTSTESPLALLDFIQVFVEALDRLFENVFAAAAAAAAAESRAPPMRMDTSCINTGGSDSIAMPCQPLIEYGYRPQAKKAPPLCKIISMAILGALQQAN